jgi:hypothetical protein
MITPLRDIIWTAAVLIWPLTGGCTKIEPDLRDNASFILIFSFIVTLLFEQFTLKYLSLLICFLRLSLNKFDRAKERMANETKLEFYYEVAFAAFGDFHAFGLCR